MEINTIEEFSKNVLKSTDTILVDFYADWCNPCKAQSKELSQIEDQIKIAKVNIDDISELVDFYDIQSIPTLILFNSGKIVDRSTGFKNKNQLIEFIS